MLVFVFKVSFKTVVLKPEHTSEFPGGGGGGVLKFQICWPIPGVSDKFPGDADVIDLGITL